MFQGLLSLEALFSRCSKNYCHQKLQFLNGPGIILTRSSSSQMFQGSVSLEALIPDVPSIIVTRSSSSQVFQGSLLQTRSFGSQVFQESLLQTRSFGSQVFQGSLLLEALVPRCSRDHCCQKLQFLGVPGIIVTRSSCSQVFQGSLLLEALVRVKSSEMGTLMEGISPI